MTRQCSDIALQQIFLFDPRDRLLRRGISILPLSALGH
jgi:hypothetical protein